MTLAAHGLPYNHLVIAVDAGYFYLAGVKNRVDSIHLAPFTLAIGYRVPLSGNLFVEPFIAGGYSFISINYLKSEYAFGPLVQYSETAFEPVFRGGANLRYEVNSSYFVSAGVYYGFIYEATELMQYAGVVFGAGMWYGL